MVIKKFNLQKYIWLNIYYIYNFYNENNIFIIYRYVYLMKKEKRFIYDSGVIRVRFMKEGKLLRLRIDRISILIQKMNILNELEMEICQK